MKSLPLPRLAALSALCLLAQGASRAFAATPLPPIPEDGLRIATWNVENFFDAVDDPKNPGDDEFTPGSWRRWTDERYQAKTRNLAEAIAALRPDILFLSEVENRDVLTNLVHALESLPAPHPMPYIAHEESDSNRGIDVAILSRHPLRDIVLHKPVPNMRGILEATAEIPNAPSLLLACHWKSRVGNRDENIAIRQREATAVRALLLARLAADPNLSFFVGGDFNDDCTDDSVRLGLGAIVDRAALAAPKGADILFYDLIGDIPEKDRGSYYYARTRSWNTYDAIVVPPGAAIERDGEEPAWRIPAASPHAGVFKPTNGTDDQGRPMPFRRVRRKDGTDQFMNGCSDHFPIWADFVRAEP